MKRLRFLNILAIALLTAGMLAAAVQDVSASPGLGPDEPPAETPAPPKPPGDEDGEGDTGDSSDTNKEGGILTKIFKVVFDSSTMKDAIVTAINFIFYDGTVSLTAKSNPLYVLGSQISELVFRSTELADLRKTSWIQLRKVAFALLPLAAALTIWASMKEGLYSVTGYANTYEAVAEFFVSIALALASYWLMEQSITLVKILSTAISDSMQTNITMDVWQGMLHKNTFLLTSGAGNSIMSMVLGIISFCVALAYIFSVVFAFLAREVVILLTVALAPLMIILGTIRPLSWLRALWAKAFMVFLLLLPVNVLVMGLSFKLWSSIANIKTQAAATFLQLAILIGVLSVLVALNGTVGKMVFGAAVEATKKIGTAVMSAGALAGGLLVGAGGLSAAAATTGGTAASTGGSIAPTTGGGGGLGVTAGSLSGAGSVTNTSKLSASIGSILSSSRNPVLRSASQGLRAGNAIKDYKTSQAELAANYKSPPVNMKNGVPGFEKGLSDVTSLVDTDQKAMAYGPSSETMKNRVVAGGEIASNTMRAANEEGLYRGFLSETGNLHPGRTNMYLAGREHTRSVAGEYALKQRNPYFPNKVNTSFPDNPNVDPRDYAISEKIMINEHRRLEEDPNQKPFDVNKSVVNDVVSAVYSSRINSGLTSYNEVFDSVNESDDFLQWVKDNK